LHVKLEALLAALILIGAPGLTAAQPSAPAAPAAPTPVVVTTPLRANLNISPKRVTFDRTHRSGSIFIFNQGTAAATFDISLVDRVMLPDGRIMALADALANPETKAVAERVKSAQSMLQISPRRVALKPGQGQTIRMRVVGAGDDPTLVEARSHLTISTIPPRETGTTAEAAAAPTPPDELRFQITALFGLSVPAIVRLTDPQISAALENPTVTSERVGGTPSAPGPATPVLNLELVRRGANSLFGNIEVRVQGQPKAAALGVARGVGVYPEIDRRAVHVALSRAPAPGEHLEITFTDDDTAPGKLLAKIVL
jgi:hypothetical protein